VNAIRLGFASFIKTRLASENMKSVIKRIAKWFALAAKIYPMTSSYGETFTKKKLINIFFPTKTYCIS
jgi:hypothetical protein